VVFFLDAALAIWSKGIAEEPSALTHPNGTRLMLTVSPRTLFARLRRLRAVCQHAGRPRRYHPKLELLEDRLVLDGTGVTPPPPANAPPPPSPHGPVAVRDDWGYQIDSPTPVPVLQNDTDPNSGATLDPSSVTVVTPPQYGQALPDPSTGIILYTPNALLPGGSGQGFRSDTFTYYMRDSLGLVSNVATVQVNPVSPVGGGDIVPQPDFGNTVTLAPVSVDVLSNDQVNDGSAADPNSVTVTSPPSHGVVSVDHTTGAVTYVPNFGFVGVDAIGYSVKTTAGHGPGQTFVVFAVYPEAPRVQPDPFGGGTMLVVDGTSGNDVIRFFPGHNPGDIMVTINGVTKGPFQPTSRIVAFGYGGNDRITAAPTIKLPVWIDGGPGNDFIQGGGGTNVLLGGAGNDVLIGGLGRDLLIGGAGRDVLMGNGGGDILIAGSTSYDNNQAALGGIVQLWTSGLSYAQRVSDRVGVGAILNAQTVQADNGLNVMTGGGSHDLYFAATTGKTLDILTNWPHRRLGTPTDEMTAIVIDIGKTAPQGHG
jgi:hypothetical protein